ncbi:ABC transporter permease [Microbacterium aquimaris]|uniref:ABC transporter permease n=1 Tax=Microbacterium aquimaris TaxID=459816 RepID=A0ABU5N473_9MICO|nr:ABC transporter permease [Microbacterium aquimaris]MDZ8160825.1 ABC transporter permease [Microbacterium aquimaris]MDZ8275248.1 ABC transporter permease [Microbacterium aquimaris]
MSEPTVLPPVRRAARDRNGLLRGLRYPSTIVGVIVAVSIIAIGLLAPILPIPSPYAQSPDAFLPPSAQHWLGTDEFGRDLFSRVVYGIRQDALVGAIAVPLGAAIGVVLGLVSTTSKYLDIVLQRIFDVSLAFAGIVMGVTVAAILGPGIMAVLVTVTLINIPLFGRLTRSAARAQLSRDYVVAARVTGAGPVRVLGQHVLPNAVDPLVVQAALSLSIAVFIEGGMSFVGIGVVPPEPSLGALLRSSTDFMSISPQYALAPMIVLTALVMSFYVISDGLNRGLLKR